MMIRHFLPLFAMAVLLASCSPAAVVPSAVTFPGRTVILRNADGTELSLQVEVAVTSEQQATGMMGRQNVVNGMLFTFEEPQELSFWMKNTLVPLDILFFATDGSFTGSARMEPCRTELCPSYYSPGPAQYALEMPAGFVDREGIGEGWSMKYEAMQNAK
ncbi:MAG: DUF192 domain-containing protein [Candidatus Peribacteraceae bacterium]|jgi:hypothetical protein